MAQKTELYELQVLGALTPDRLKHTEHHLSETKKPGRMTRPIFRDSPLSVIVDFRLYGVSSIPLFLLF